MAIAGHLFLIGRALGGKGVATAAGAMAVLQPLVSIVLALVWLAVSRLTRKASLASRTAAVGLPVGTAIAGAPG